MVSSTEHVAVYFETRDQSKLKINPLYVMPSLRGTRAPHGKNNSPVACMGILVLDRCPRHTQRLAGPGCLPTKKKVTSPRLDLGTFSVLD
jgi:hypothetical protein